MSSDNFKGKGGARRPVPVGSFMMRRVFRQENSYCCGICRQFHASVEEANECLTACWKAVLHRAPWMTVKKIGQTGFACIYCQRIYSTTELAATCAEDCATKMTITSLDGTDLNPVKVKRTFAKQNLKPVVNFPFKIGGRKDETEGDAHGDGTGDSAHLDAAASANVAPPTTAATAQAAPPPAEEPKKEAAAEADKTPVDRTKKFERVGSKYECVICHKKYFEKVQVEKCFDAHAGGAMDAHQNSGV